MKPRKIPPFSLEAELNKPDAGIDSTPLTFGKHAGKTPEEVAEEDPSYIIWMYENVKNAPVSRFLYELTCMDEGKKPSYLSGYLRFK